MLQFVTTTYVLSKNKKKITIIHSKAIVLQPLKIVVYCILLGVIS